MLETMERRAGFTIVEVSVTLAIMAVLVVIVAASLNSSQIGSRDTERKTDVENIARSLESYYASGRDDIGTQGVYPGTSVASQANTSTRVSWLPNIERASLYAPGTGPTGTTSFVPATNAVETEAGVTPQPTITTYVYQPLRFNSATNTFVLCTDHITTECRKFNLFYRNETDNSITKITSVNQ